MRKTVTTIEITSDISGDEATERREFVWKGTGYALDLTVAEAAQLDEFMGPYVAVAQVLKKRAAPGQGKRVRPPRNKETTAIREWAAVRGIEINPQGRIPNEVREQYDAEQKITTTQAPAKATGKKPVKDKELVEA